MIKKSKIKLKTKELNQEIENFTQFKASECQMGYTDSKTLVENIMLLSIKNFMRKGEKILPSYQTDYLHLKKNNGDALSKYLKEHNNTDTLIQYEKTI